MNNNCNNITFSYEEINNLDKDLIEASSMFNTRYSEAYHYINYLKSLEMRETRVYFCDRKDLSSVDREFIQICRANAYVILYNLVESTIFELVKGLYKHLGEKLIDIDTLIDQLKIIIFKGIKKSSNNDFKNFCQILNNDFRKIIFEICFHPDKVDGMFSGNLDAKKIRSFAEEHGIILNITPESKNGGKLVEIKNTRNDLAHGSASFKDRGKQTAQNLYTLCLETGYYLRSVILSVNEFLYRENYYKDP